MHHNRDLSGFSLVRLNADSFPVSKFEQAACEAHGMQQTCVEASGMNILTHAADCDALFVVAEALPAALIDGLVKCRVISRLGAGTDKIDRNAATRNGILITNVPDFCVEEQADHTMALLLALVRKLPQMDRAMKAGSWSAGREQCRSIRRFEGRTLGLLGFGRSAKAVARRAAGFGFKIIATRRRMAEHDDDAKSLSVELVDVDSVIRESDYLSLHLPLNDHTYRFLDADRLASMKRGAYLINTSRGAIVDETALAELLRQGHLAGAGLDTYHEIDVHSRETTPTHPLLELENVICTPHVAAFSVESSHDVGTGAVENVAAVLRGKWPSADRIVNTDVSPRFKLSR